MLTDLRFPETMDAAAEFVSPDDLKSHVRISSDCRDHLNWLREDLEMGFDSIMIHNVNRDQLKFIADFSRNVLPALTAGSGHKTYERVQCN